MEQERRGRRSIRLRRFDYDSGGAYFITLRVHNDRHLFGEVVDGVMDLNPIGRMIVDALANMPARWPRLEIDESVLMPNHMHAIVRLSPRPDCMSIVPALREPGGRVTGIPSIVGEFKSITTHSYIEGVRTRNWPPFLVRLWQRNYWEHVIRSDEDLGSTRHYIRSNPKRWSKRKRP